MNIDKLISEEIEKFKLFSKYSPKKTFTENLNEQKTNLGCIPNALFVKRSSGESYAIINGVNYYNNGRFYKRDQGVGSWKCSDSYAGTLELRFDTDPKAISYQTVIDQNNSQSGNQDNKNTPVDGSMSNKEKKSTETSSKPQQKWNPEEFPLQYMDQGPNVKKLQQALDVRNKAGKPNITGKFFNATQFALDKKAKELGLSYDRKKGLTKDDFDKIIAARETFSSGGASDFDNEETLTKRDQQQNQS